MTSPNAVTTLGSGTTMAHSRIVHHSALLALIAAMTVALAGCGGYTLQGRVIRGTVPKVEIVHQMDLRLRSPAGGGPVGPTDAKSLMPPGAGVNNVEISLYRDPQSMDAHLADRDRTNGEGYF